MAQATLYPADSTTNPTAPASNNLDEAQQRAATSPSVAWSVIVGLPALGVFAAVCAALPVFAALMAGSFLLATTSVCRTALATFTGKTLQLLVASRFVIVCVVGALLFCVSGAAWAIVVSAVLLWLTAERLIGRRALHDLWRASKDRR